MQQNDIMIRVRNVRKRYRLGQIGGGTLRGDLQSWWARKRDVNIETERKPKTRTTEITADEFYVAVLSNEAKVVLAKFKA